MGWGPASIQSRAAKVAIPSARRIDGAMTLQFIAGEHVQDMSLPKRFAMLSVRSAERCLHVTNMRSDSQAACLLVERLSFHRATHPATVLEADGLNKSSV